MPSDLPLTDQPPSVTAKPRACDKVRIRFRKGGDLRLVSHRDLVKRFERILRRARLPIHVTQGFHPLPRLVFAMSLGLGIIGSAEVLELEFTEPIEPDDIGRRLSEQMPPGLEILDVRRIPVKSSAQVRRAGYRVNVPADRLDDLQARVDALLAAPELHIERSRPAPRRLDLRPYIAELRLVAARFQRAESPSRQVENLPPQHAGQLEMLLWVTPTGAARPGEVLGLLGLGDLVESGVPMERHVLEIHDECPQLASEREGSQ